MPLWDRVNVQNVDFRISCSASGLMQNSRAVPDACLLQGPGCHISQMLFVRYGLLLHVDRVQNKLSLSFKAFFSLLRSGLSFFAINDFDISKFVFAFKDFAAAKISFFCN